MMQSEREISTDAVCLADFEAMARERISHLAYEYISGGASDEITMRWNQEAFARMRLRTRVRLFGDEYPFPILLAPTAYHRLIHPEGEIATAKGASAAGATFVVSTMATTSVEEIARET